MSQFFLQGPNEVVEYQINWTGVLPDGVTISTSTWTNADLTIANDLVDGDFTAVTISDGVVGGRYIIENSVLLSNGEVYTDSILLYFEEK